MYRAAVCGRVSAPKRGLGKGLGALLGDAPVPVSPSAETLAEIPVDRITPNPYQPRKHFDPDAQEELKSSICEFGVLVPIIVRRRGDAFELIAGERRWRAARRAGLQSIPALVKTVEDRGSLEQALVENLHQIGRASCRERV